VIVLLALGCGGVIVNLERALAPIGVITSIPALAAASVSAVASRVERARL
jgi:hypothetical protein